MLLKIIDLHSVDGSGPVLKVVYDAAGRSRTIVIDEFESPFTANFRQQLRWYYSEYLHQDKPLNGSGESAAMESGVTEKLVKFGQYLGDALLGEDHELQGITEDIGDRGYPNLRVEIHSSREEFFLEPWELLVLPESKFVLSSVVNGFVRVDAGWLSRTSFSELHCALRAPSPTPGMLPFFPAAGVDTGNGRPEADQQPEPLRILMLVSRPSSVSMPFDASDGLNYFLDSFRTEGAIDYEICQVRDWSQVDERLAEDGKPIHIVHYDGPVMLGSDSVNFVFDTQGGTETDVAVVLKRLVDRGIPVLSVDPRACSRQGLPCSANIGIAKLASIASKTGLANVMGLAEVTDPWHSSECFRSLYTHVAAGLSLAQAVVETRKALQARVESRDFSIRPLPFHHWPLLIHYGVQDVRFFASGIALVHLEESSLLQKTKNKMYGFLDHMLPPSSGPLIDRIFSLLADAIDMRMSRRRTTPLLINGENGSGRTCMLHAAGIYISRKAQIQYCFYFDFAEMKYSFEDLMEMIGPVLKNERNPDVDVAECLRQVTCGFIFDNVPRSDNERSERAEFMKELAADGHLVVLAADNDPGFSIADFETLELRVLSTVEKKRLAVNAARGNTELTDSSRDELAEVLTFIDAQPFFAVKLPMLVGSLPSRDLIEQMGAHVNANQSTDKVLGFYEWQWEALSHFSQMTLLLCAQLKGLVLELLMIAWEQKEDGSAAGRLAEILSDRRSAGGQAPQNSFSLMIRDWEKRGFTTKTQIGRIIDRHALRFLESKINKVDLLDSIDVKRCFGQLLCEGIARLSQHVIDKQHPRLMHYLLANRRQWVEHFERLWFHGEYRSFIRTKNAFDQLLKQAGLEHESQQWALSILSRTPLSPHLESATSDRILSWLSLALHSLKLKEAAGSDAISSAAVQFQALIETTWKDSGASDVALFRQATSFLEEFYTVREDWMSCSRISEMRCSVFRTLEAWYLVIQSLRSRVRCEYELGNVDKARELEDEIMHGISYDSAPAGLREQQMLQILLDNVAREDCTRAQQLLGRLRSVENKNVTDETLDAIQADIHFHAQDYLAALPYYGRLWVSVLSTGIPKKIIELRERILKIRACISADEFDASLGSVIPAHVILPQDYERGSTEFVS